jgi:hypothetical protein
MENPNPRIQTGLTGFTGLNPAAISTTNHANNTNRIGILIILSNLSPPFGTPFDAHIFENASTTTPGNRFIVFIYPPAGTTATQLINNYEIAGMPPNSGRNTRKIYPQEQHLSNPQSQIYCPL